LKVSLGQHSDQGRKALNQDFHGACVPHEPQLSAKGIVVALADGISTSTVSHIASEAAVTGFLADYFCTPEAWSVKQSAQRVLIASNSWLHAQTRQSEYRYDLNRGYVCTFSALVLKSNTAHIFHVGDARIYRVHGSALEQLTHDHRLRIGPDQSYLARALGISPQLEVDYQSVPLAAGDVFLLATDGVYEHVSAAFVGQVLAEHADDLQHAAKAIVEEAYAQGSSDNLTAQIVRIDALPAAGTRNLHEQLHELPLPPLLEPRMEFDGYRIVREVHASSRSHVYLASDLDSGAAVILKIPSLDLRDNPAYLERFMMEEWIARRIDSVHVLKPCLPPRQRSHLYIVSEYIDGQTLSQWMIDNPKPGLQSVREIIEQIAKGLRAFHRLEMLHQDLRPANVMIDNTGTVRIIDFGSTRVAGVAEIDTPLERNNLLGTAQYSAPEYFLGESGTARSDLFALGVIAYQMLSGKLPYGAEVAKAQTRAAQCRLSYASLLLERRELPLWVDGAIRKAVHPNPAKRYAELSEFIFDLSHPNRDLLDRPRPPLLEHNPLLFWKGVSLLLALTVVALLVKG